MKLLLDTKTTPLPSLDLPSDLSVELSRTNPFLTNEGSQSIPFTIPASSGNLVKLGFPERLRPTTRPETKRPAILLDGSAWIKGTLYIESVNMKEGITCTFYTNEGRLYEQLKKYTLQTLPFDKIGTEGQSVDSLISGFESEINGTQTESEMYAFCGCGTDLVFNLDKSNESNYDLILNEIQYKSGSTSVEFIGKTSRKYFNGTGDSAKEITVPAGYGISPFMKVSYILNKMFSSLGYDTNLYQFASNASFNRLVVLNNVLDSCVKGGGISPSSLLPDMDCEEFISAFRKKFGMEFIENNNTIEMRSWEDVLKLSPDYEIRSIEEPTISYEDAKGIYMSLNNLTDGNLMDYYTITHNPPEGMDKEEISFSDYTPTINNMRSAYILKITGGGIPSMYCWGPDMGSNSHINTELKFDDSEEAEDESNDKLSLVFCFALKGIKVDKQDPSYKYPFIEGTLREYDFEPARSDSQWGQFNLFVNALEDMESLPGFYYGRNLYETFYKRRDEMLQKANQQIVCRAKIPAHIINSMDISRPKILDGQKVMIERIDYTLGKSELCQITARTLHLMNE